MQIRTFIVLWLICGSIESLVNGHPLLGIAFASLAWLLDWWQGGR